MKRDTCERLASSLCAVLLFAASAGRAVDGVIEINDASVQAAGGYPALIGASGSYVLTGNLTPPAGSHGINVTAADVTIDLNGFQILAAGAGSNGINAGFLTGVTVRNGSVTGFDTGISLSPWSKVIGVHVTNSSVNGILCPGGCLILQSTIAGSGVGIGISASRSKIENSVIENHGIGISGFANLIVHSQILNNGGGGVLAFGASVIRENLFEENGAYGISDGTPGPPPFVPPPPGPPFRLEIVGNSIQGTFFGPGITTMRPALIENNIVSANATDGILCGAACIVRGNVVESNNITAAIASGGVTVADGSNVTDNSISFNTGFGLALPPTAGYSQNTFIANGPLDVVSGGPHPTSGFNNLCSGVAGPALTCP